MNTGSSMTAYGRTWPLRVTPKLCATIHVEAPLNPEADTEDQMFEFERSLRDKLPEGIEIQVETVDEYRLSPEDQIEHDRLENEALQRRAA